MPLKPALAGILDVSSWFRVPSGDGEDADDPTLTEVEGAFTLLWWLAVCDIQFVSTSV
jgi:hypothetical protein